MSLQAAQVAVHGQAQEVIQAQEVVLGEVQLILVATCGRLAGIVQADRCPPGSARFVANQNPCRSGRVTGGELHGGVVGGQTVHLVETLLDVADVQGLARHPRKGGTQFRS